MFEHITDFGNYIILYGTVIKDCMIIRDLRVEIKGMKPKYFKAASFDAFGVWSQ